MSHEMDGKGEAVRITEELIDELERIYSTPNSERERRTRITFHPTNGGPTVGEGIFVKQQGMESGTIRGRFVPSRRQDNEDFSE
jgi:hypothetical protein